MLRLRYGPRRDQNGCRSKRYDLITVFRPNRQPARRPRHGRRSSGRSCRRTDRCLSRCDLMCYTFPHRRWWAWSSLTEPLRPFPDRLIHKPCHQPDKQQSDCRDTHPICRPDPSYRDNPRLSDDRRLRPPRHGAQCASPRRHHRQGPAGPGRDAVSKGGTAPSPGLLPGVDPEFSRQPVDSQGIPEDRPHPDRFRRRPGGP